MQPTESQTAPGKGVVTGLCVECAVRQHDFREILGRGVGDDQLSEPPLPEAWIDGRRHRLLPYIGTEEATCRECNRSVPSLYIPTW